MTSLDEKKKQRGEKILNNYKKQLAERLARERLEKGEPIDQNASNKTDPGKVTDFVSTEVPEPEVLLAILNRKSKHLANKD